MKTIQEQINNWLDTGKCQCKLCERGRNFARIIQTIESPEDQEWMFWFYDGVVSTEEELGLQEYWVNENQKRIDKLEAEKNELINRLTDLKINAATKQSELLNEKYNLYKHKKSSELIMMNHIVLLRELARLVVDSYESYQPEIDALPLYEKLEEIIKSGALD